MKVQDILKKMAQNQGLGVDLFGWRSYILLDDSPAMSGLGSL